MINNRNPHNICTWADASQCGSCELQNKLHCRKDPKQRFLWAFHGATEPFVLTVIFGMIIVGIAIGLWWPLWAYLAFTVLFFGFYEIRILCSHCPYYAEKGKILHCTANQGVPKIWKYRPGPMNKFERMSMLVGAGIFAWFPFLPFGYGIFKIANSNVYGTLALLGIIGITVASLLMIIAWFVFVWAYCCPNCVNFSCPFNKVPKPLKDVYLRKNPVMKEAWEKSGYKLG